MSSWWREAALYQIYPRSFQDSEGDGVGDIEGIGSRLDYISDLGVGAVWLSPIFRSPMADFGYDVSDYCDIDPLFGDMAAFDRLLEETHSRGLKLLLDFVPNHSSDQHPWFKESRSSRDNPRRDWYIWRDPAPDGGPPNNWMSNFGGSAWTWDEATGQYYYHAFLAAQPDLNWRNSAVREAMQDVLRFWLDKGVDGFRVDVIWHLIKDDRFRDNPPNPGYAPDRPEIDRYLQVHSADQPEVHDVITELRAVIESYPDRLLIGEIYLPIDRLMTYYGKDNQGVHLPFNFQLIHCPWHAEAIGGLIDEYEAALPRGGWPNWVLSNHDQPRIAARVGDTQARIAAMLLLTLRGTPTLYYGDEIGIGDVDMTGVTVLDPAAINEPGISFNRDRSRSPMQWSDIDFAGFSDVKPWLPLTNDWPERNRAMQSAQPTSMLNLYRALLRLRSIEADLLNGAYRRVATDAPILAYQRGQGVGVVLNLSADDVPLALPPEWRAAHVMLSAREARSLPNLPGTLAAGEGLILRISGGPA
ncbi:MAG: alpha-amylase family glycosyl hydrolase [Sphingobium sp.]|uniref:alpha-amylase family glycosyl hydrolase n=1 Tax=Sphingobium sp. TaxID=1912891 RepID=UPI0029BCEC48|nr:alpha-amylase family glycosyl hydrolase [Sphingobium sp.]MDX3910158.1 alpha-amylase family glycosyl hydrolase [Sphingobium sp.]